MTNCPQSTPAVVLFIDPFVGSPKAAPRPKLPSTKTDVLVTLSTLRSSKLCSCGGSKCRSQTTRCPPERSYIGARFKCRDCGSVAAITMSQIKTGSETFSPALEQWRTR